MKKILLERDTALRCTYVYVGCGEDCNMYACPNPPEVHRTIGAIRDSELYDVAKALVRLVRKWRLQTRKVTVELG